MRARQRGGRVGRREPADTAAEYGNAGQPAPRQVGRRMARVIHSLRRQVGRGPGSPVNAGGRLSAEAG